MLSAKEALLAKYLDFAGWASLFLDHRKIYGRHTEHKSIR